MQDATSDPAPEDDRRTFSPYEMFLTRARQHRPRFRFDFGAAPSWEASPAEAGPAKAGHPQAGHPEADGTAFARWREQALPPVIGTLGHAPEPVEANPRLLGEWERYGVLQQRWLIDVSPGFSATAVVNRPASLRAGEHRPGILCWHGHTTPSWIGKEAMMGNDTDPDLQANAADAGYGLAMAREGYVTFAIDWMGYGDSDDNSKPNHRPRPGEHVWCNVYYLQATMLGMTPLGINLAHGRALVDFARTLEYVDPARLGVLGFSGGGVLALWSGLTDSRLVAIQIACYSDLFADFGYRDVNYCGAQIAPGLYELVDVPDLQGLLAPKPLLVDVGAYDRCFRLDSAMACHRRVARIYRAAGAEARLHLNLFPGGHRWDATESGAFFAEYLAAAPG